MSISIEKKLCVLRALSRTIFNVTFYIACCASITGCAGVLTVHVKSKIEDVYIRDQVHSVQSASIEDGHLKVCVSASNFREKVPVNYILNIPYEKAPLWYKNAEERFYKRNHRNRNSLNLTEIWKSAKPAWSEPDTNVDPQPCEILSTRKQIKVLNIVRLSGLYSNYLGWYLDEGDENTKSTNKERTAKVTYKNVALMLNDIVKSGLIENETVAVISQVIIGGVKKEIPYYVSLYYFDPVIKYSNTSYFKFSPPSHLVKGKKTLYMLLPFTYLFDTITFPVQMWMLINSGP